ncbi:MAG TPA: TadE/TadG family type IV pilus assembly protein [Isosphaeraceae bacterium]|nr:TadE/TadG family type IV pilus assembly protein [Isosphaeraceae bacterium]
MIDRRSDRARRHGAAAVELALLLPMLMILVSGMFEVSRMAEVQQIMTNAAREGARQASTGQINNTAIKAVVTEYLQNALNDGDSTGNTGRNRTANLVITVTNLTSSDSSGTPPRTDATGAQQLDQFQVTATIPFKDLKWSTPSLITNSSTQVIGVGTWNSMKDKNYPAPPTPPLG